MGKSQWKSTLFQIICMNTIILVIITIKEYDGFVEISILFQSKLSFPIYEYFAMLVKNSHIHVMHVSI